MNKQRITNVFLIIICIGLLVSIFGMFASSGIAPEAYPLWQIIFDIFVIFYFLGLVLSSREKNKNAQSQAERNGLIIISYLG